MPRRDPAIRVLLLPKDTNGHGTIFGGVILSHLDLASAVQAQRVAPRKFVTRAMRAVEFHEPVYVGDLVSFYAETLHVGRTSVTVRVIVEAERRDELVEREGRVVKVTEAEVVLVAVDDAGRPVPVRGEVTHQLGAR
jgi:acyl-CoA thioesterase YciA